MYYKQVTITINASNLAEVIIDMAIQYNNLSNLIISDFKAISMSKF